MRPVSAGMSLLEVLIASALMMTAVAGIFEALTATKHLSSNAEAKDDLQMEADVVMRTITSDLNLSGWHLPLSEDFDRDNTLDVGEDLNANGALDVLTYAAQTRAQDRDAWYYPYVQIQGITSAGGRHFEHALRGTAQYEMPPLPDVLPGNPSDTALFGSDETGWLETFSGRSQEIVFLKATVGQWDAALDEYRFQKTTGSYAAAVALSNQGQTLDFEGTRAAWQTAGNHDALGVLHPSGWAPVYDVGGSLSSFSQRTPNLPYGVILDAGWYDANAEATDEDATIKVQWETIDDPQYSVSDYAPSRLREYMYALVPSPTTGFGRLVRAVKIRTSQVNTALQSGQGVEIGQILWPTDATSGYRMEIDRVLSDNVTRILFDTYRTVDRDAAEVTTLAANQVRVRIYMARRQATNPNLIISRVFETIIGMRARSSASEVTATTTILGTQPIGLVR